MNSDHAEFLLLLFVNMPQIIVIFWSKAWTVFARLNAVIMGLNPT
jgi:hypothetical protein